MQWAQITVTISQDASDAVANYLFGLNAFGVEIKEGPASTTCLIAYYPMDDRVGSKLQKLQEFLAQLPTWGFSTPPTSQAECTLERVESEAWGESWKTAFPPQRIGSRLLIAPTWADIVPNQTDILIRLDPGMAFGTGYHPTTRLSLKLLEETVSLNHCIADIGTGSGILTVAAVKLGARQVDAIELDPTAIPVAETNFRNNGVNARVRLFQGDGLKSVRGRYHVIVGNILTKAILPIIPNCAEHLHPEGIVIFSGILHAEQAQVKSVLATNGFQSFEVKSEAEDGIMWVAIKAQLRNASALSV